MARVTAEDIKKLARLARLNLTEEQIAQYVDEFEKILEYVAKLESADTKGLEPTSQVTGLTNVTREDEIKDYGVTREDLLKNAPEQKAGYIKVKRVL